MPGGDPAADAREIADWGLTEYLDALGRQHELVRLRLRNAIPDTLVLTEHHPVVTLGRGSHAANLLDVQTPVIDVERGGDVTWHGPGQLVGYLIRLLPSGARDLHAHLRSVETLVISALSDLDIEAGRVDGKTGVWVEHGGSLRKVASIGVAARNWCTYHGFALNVNPDLAAFRCVNPCGFDASVMTSIAEIAPDRASAARVKHAVASVWKALVPQPGG